MNVNAQKGILKVNTRIDNLGYWKKMAGLGLVNPNPVVVVPNGIYTGSSINNSLVVPVNSPDVVINNTTGNTQSENSVSINPNQKTQALNSNNSVDNPSIVLGTSSFTTINEGLNWQGSTNGAGGTNSGDPAAAISNDGRYYIGFIDNSFGQGIAVSTDQGSSWQTYTVSPPNGLLDKNHLWVDKSLASPFVNNVYSAWTDFGGPNDSRIALASSTNGGVTWNTAINISQATAGGSHDQGVNINSGPNGEVYAVWSIYDSWPSDESAIGFASSINGGASFNASQRIVDNIRGVRITGVGKDMRTNSFPSLAVDNSFGPKRGTLYVVWANIGIPGTNTGDDVDIYLIQSINEGLTWTAPQKVNTSTAGHGNKHYFPWITCDQATGKLHIVYYDDRDVTAAQCEAWMSSSFDGGATWSDYKVSDVSFTPTPIPGLAFGYFGDYLSVSANDDIVYPVWTDNRTGNALAYTSPLISSDFCPSNLVVQNITLPINATYKYRAENTISIANSGTIFVMQGNGTTGARASMVAGKSITLSPKTSVEKGVVLTIVPGLCSSPILRQGAVAKEFTRLNIQPQEFEINSQIIIYPNPVGDYIYLELSKKLQNKTNLSYVITDLMGAVITKGLITRNLSTINTSKLPAAGYFVTLYDNKKLIETKTFIKK
jgi:Secretion system C-terminal sorting domain